MGKTDYLIISPLTISKHIGDHVVVDWALGRTPSSAAGRLAYQPPQLTTYRVLRWPVTLTYQGLYLFFITWSCKRKKTKYYLIQGWYQLGAYKFNGFLNFMNIFQKYLTQLGEICSFATASKITWLSKNNSKTFPDNVLKFKVFLVLFKDGKNHINTNNWNILCFQTLSFCF